MSSMLRDNSDNCKNPLSCKGANRKGFTLLEILIALSLVAILTTALYGVYFSLMRGRESATAGMESRRELRVTLDMLRREIESTFYVNTNKQLHFVVEDRDIFGKPASSLEFTTITPPHAGDLPTSDQAIVRYQPLEKEKRIVLARQSRDLFFKIDPVKYPQMEDLDGFLVECYDGNKWVKSWDTPGINFVLPKAVRVTIRIREGEKTMDFFTTAIPRVMGS